jgi:DNA sulfur modification protein DndE
MASLATRRVRFCREADTWLRVLKSRSGITPNILCRLGFTLSLAEPGIPNASKYPEDSEREINRYTLLGEFDSTYVALLRQRLLEDSIEEREIDTQFRAHMNRGVLLLAARAKSLPDILTELARAPDE